jgi:hypothetical protein
MPLTLRQHVASAMEILASLGGPTILPSPANVIVRRRQKKAWMRNPLRQAVRPDHAGNKRDYALSVKILVEAYDRTGWMLEWLTASDDTASTVWHSIPDKVICFECRVERLRADVRQRCPKCGKKMLTYVGIVCADLQAVAGGLRAGGVGCE